MGSRARIALVTGGSSGIGRATSISLQRAGFVVVGTSRSPRTGSSLRQLDVTDLSSVAACVDGVLAEHGAIDVMVNNAGVTALGAFEEMSDAQVQDAAETNIFGAMRMARAVLPHMRAAGSGRIINVSSVMGFVPAPYMAVYSATKHALEGFSESLDHEVREFGVRSTLVEPAYTRTGFEAAATAPDVPIDAYVRQRATAAEVLASSMEVADDAEVVASVIVRAATVASPRLRYPAGKVARRVSVLRRIAPASAFDAQIRKLNRLA